MATAVTETTIAMFIPYLIEVMLRATRALPGAICTSGIVAVGGGTASACFLHRSAAVTGPVVVDHPMPPSRRDTDVSAM